MEDGKLACKVLLFAAASDVCGKREAQLSMPRNSSIGDVFDVLSETSPELCSLRSRCAFAMDQKICSSDTQLLDGCTIAILPPVSGG